ncbi:HD domain-containing protein [Neobacillus bataviensis]|uniref:HD domain-containing protein n=1 Tax=Neobacillus bataviensis TaxID=220685 RepID=UPI001CBD4168|nr:HD domain-containing protein [Neobacillus bataviensis]
MKIISHPLFQRLRKIKQNTFLYFVFPSAHHTRFEHSLGVMYLASEMFLNALNNASTLKNKQKKYAIEGNKNILDKDYFNIDDFVEIFLNLRIAALLHDIGHGPMSHLFEEFAPKSAEFIGLVKGDNSIKINNEFAYSLEEIIRNKGSMDEKVEHEYVSYYFTAKVLTDIGLMPDRIKTILSIMNEQLNLSTIFIREYNLIPFLNQIVAGAPLDCDRMDYLLRDSYFTGVKYGTYDLNRLLKSLLPFMDQESKKVRLGIKKSGLPAIENFVQARYELYVQVYFHKTSKACEAMLSHATRKLRENGYEFVKCHSVEQFVADYLKFSDDAFLDSFEAAIPDEEDKITIRELRNRKLWKRIIEIYPEKGQMRKKDIDKKIKKVIDFIIKKDLKLLPYVKESVTTNDPLKDLNGENAILLNKDHDENYFIAEDGAWIEDSIIFKALSNKYLVGRVYMRADTKTENGREFFRKIKQEIQQFKFS